MQVNVLEAKTDFSKLLRLLETKRESAITIARNGKPVAIMTLYPEQPVSKRIGIAKGKFHDPEDFDTYDDEIAAMLTGGDL
jgi:antitoxin (DNA-binding transcriptional repressor) of toxin-antitoxin stability system